MNLYPNGHPPFIARGICMDQNATDEIRQIADERSLERCLTPAWWHVTPSRYYVELLRANLFRAEALIDTQPLPAKDGYVLLPHEIPALLESLKAATKCLEEWLESETCKRILAKYPTRPRIDSTSPGTNS